MDEEKSPKYSIVTLIFQVIVLIAVIVCRVMGKITTPVCLILCLIIVVFTARWVVTAIKDIMNSNK